MEYEARLGTPQGEQPVKRPNLQCRPQASEWEQVVEGILQMLRLRIPGRPLLQQVDVFDLGPRQFAQPPGFGGGIAGQMSLPKMTEDISIVPRSALPVSGGRAIYHPRRDQRSTTYHQGVDTFSRPRYGGDRVDTSSRVSGPPNWGLHPPIDLPGRPEAVRAKPSERSAQGRDSVVPTFGTPLG